MGGVPSVGVFLRDPSPYLREFRRKQRKNSERLGRQARPGFEPGTSRLPVFRTEPYSHLWGQGKTVLHPCLIRDSNTGTSVQPPAPLATTPLGRPFLKGHVMSLETFYNIFWLIKTCISLMKKSYQSKHCLWNFFIHPSLNFLSSITIKSIIHCNTILKKKVLS